MSTPHQSFRNRLLLLTILLALPVIHPTPLHALTRKQTLAMLRTGLVDLRRYRSACRRKTMLAAATSPCDLDRDKLLNRDEKKMRTRRDRPDTDGDGLTDYQELRFYQTNPRKKDSDGDGTTDGDEVHGGTDPSNPSSGGNNNYNEGGSGTCTEPNFDGNGSTTPSGAGVFGLPSTLTGNIAAGEGFYNQRCARCHTLNAGKAKGYHLTFPVLTTKLALPVMRLSLAAQDQANLVAFLNADLPGGTGNCSEIPATPPPANSGTPVPSPTPTITPTPYIPPTPCAGGNFTAQGNTVTGAFEIPAALTGNTTAGASQYVQSCGTGGCHGTTVRNPGWHFNQLKTAVISPPMSLTNISDQTFANIVAYLNQTDTGGCSMGTPTPVPTPNPVAYGAQIFVSSCGMSGCHSLTSTGRPREMDRHPSRSKIHEALRQGPDDMPTFHYFTLGPSAPPYSVQEEALYQYLHSLP